MNGGPVDVLDAHVRRFELLFEGVPVGPFVSRKAIAEAYSRQPPYDEVRLLGVPRVDGACVASDYAWAADGRRAGRMIIE